jgi:hypothetical protein
VTSSCIFEINQNTIDLIATCEVDPSNSKAVVFDQRTSRLFTLMLVGHFGSKYYLLENDYDPSGHIAKTTTCSFFAVVML